MQKNFSLLMLLLSDNNHPTSITAKDFRVILNTSFNLPSSIHLWLCHQLVSLKYAAYLPSAPLFHHHYPTHYLNYHYFSSRLPNWSHISPLAFPQPICYIVVIWSIQRQSDFLTSQLNILQIGYSRIFSFIFHPPLHPFIHLFIQEIHWAPTGRH